MKYILMNIEVEAQVSRLSRLLDSTTSDRQPTYSQLSSI